MTHKPLSALGVVLALTACASHAAIVAETQASAGYTTYDGEISVNLITTGQPSLASALVDKIGQFESTFPTAGLNDGSAAGNINYAYWATKNNGTSANWMPVTITFELAGSTAGYDISSISSIAGWSGVNLGSQQFQLLLAINGGAYTDYGTYTNVTTLGGGNNATMTTLVDDTGTIASGVTGVRFIFTDPDPSRNFQGGDGGTVIHELQVFGTATPIPEPGSYLLIGLSSCFLALGRRRCL